ncbi:MAG: CvpA family protein, partial [Anaerolineae bacterium]|nr:CvpA family protein [Anaerolineae bacterium]
MELLGLNNLDLLLLVILFIGMLIGLVRGTVPQVISLVSIWLGLVLSLWIYKIFSFRILQGLGMGNTASDTAAFIIVLIVIFHAIRLLVRYLATPPETRKRRRKSADDPLAEAAKTATERYIIGPLNLLGGMVMGFILTALWVALFLGVLQFLLQPTDLALGAFANRIKFQMNSSFLVDQFNQILWLLVQSVDLFVPRDADIFRRV